MSVSFPRLPHRSSNQSTSALSRTPSFHPFQIGVGPAWLLSHRFSSACNLDVPVRNKFRRKFWHDYIGAVHLIGCVNDERLRTDAATLPRIFSGETYPASLALSFPFFSRSQQWRPQTLIHRRRPILTEFEFEFTDCSVASLKSAARASRLSLFLQLHN